MQTGIKSLNTGELNQREKGVYATFHSWFSCAERDILSKVYRAAWSTCQRELQAPRKALPELEGGSAQQRGAVAELAALLEDELSQPVLRAALAHAGITPDDVLQSHCHDTCVRSRSIQRLGNSL